MGQIRFTPISGKMGGRLTQVPEFPGESFSLTAEAIGDVDNVCHAGAGAGGVSTNWTDMGGGVWVCTGQCTGEVSYVLTVTPGYDTVDLNMALTNESSRTWVRGMAFNHIDCEALSVEDFECARHWCRTGGEIKRLVEVPRKHSSRPQVQFYSVAGAPLASELPYCSQWDATPDVVLDNWLAVRSRDGERLAAVASRPGLFLFQNMELSCIHSAPDFGAMEPGESKQGWTRIYLVRATLADWHQRLLLEMGA